MAKVQVYTAARMKQIEDETIIDGQIDDNGDLQLTTRAGVTLSAGNIRGSEVATVVANGAVIDIPPGANDGQVQAFWVKPGRTATIEGIPVSAGLYGFLWDDDVPAWALVSSASISPGDPGDISPPTAGVLSASAITSNSFTLTATGASDETGLHPQAYSFTTNGGATWSPWQASNVFAVTGLTASTAYTCRHQVRDNADPYHTTQGAPITTTTSAVAITPGDLTYIGESRAMGGSGGTTHTYTAAPIGAASATRQLIIAVHHWSTGIRNNTVTVDGVAATPVYTPTTLNGSGVAYFKIDKPTGTTADIIATTASGFTSGPSIAVWTVSKAVNFVQGAVKTLATGSTGDSVTATSTPGGFAVGGFRTLSNSTGVPNVTWAGLTERWDGGGTSGSQVTSGGDMATPAATATATVTFPGASSALTQLGLATFAWAA